MLNYFFKLLILSSSSKGLNKSEIVMKRFGFFLVFFFSFLCISAQSWQEIEATSEFSVFQSDAVCKSSQGWDYEYKVFKFTNKTLNSIRLYYNLEIYYGEECSNCNDEGGVIKVVEIPANSSVEYSCSSNENQKIFSKSLVTNELAWKAKLTKVVLNKFKVEKI